ncbi:12069_t:CDS:1, partial [Racocetra persica]
GIILGILIVIAMIGFCCFSYFKRRYIFRDSSLSHQETGTITSRDIPKLQNNLQKNIFQNNLQNTSSNFSSHTTNQVDHSYTARLTSNAEMPSQRVDSPSLTEGGSSGFSVDGRSTPSNSLNAFQMSNTTLYYNGIEIPPPGARIIPLELQMQIGKEIMVQREDSRISLLPYLGSKYKLSDLPSGTINNRPCSL